MELNRKSTKFIVIHYTGMQSTRASLDRLTNPKFKVSCHYLISREGKIISLVPEDKIAWHAGKSKWKKFKNLNSLSIGIELQNKGHKHKYQNFTKIQIKSLIKICLKLKKKYKINKANVLGHSDIAPLRKIDPGEKFPWHSLAKKNICYYFKMPKIKNSKKLSGARNEFFNNLFKIGYRYFLKNRPKKSDKLIIKSFQRRYLPKNTSGKIDEKSLFMSHLVSKSQ